MFLNRGYAPDVASADCCISLQQRLEALADYEILDTPEEQGFDELATLAADIFEAPIAAITLIDANRQWFKAKVGIEARETPLESSMCVHGLQGSDLLVVPNAMQDPRFCDNPAVCSDDGVRFYAGARLANGDGIPLGMICVADTVPRHAITQTQARMLRTLAAQVVTQLELRKECRQRAKLTAEAEKAREDAEAATASKASFLANMSHEIRTPLNCIIGFTDLLLEDQGLGAPQKRHVQLVHDSGTALLSVINDILEFSRSETGKMDLNVEPFSVTSMVNSTVSMLRNPADVKGLAARVTINPSVTGFHAGDEQRVRQVLVNLVGNAIKFTQAGEIEVSVDVKERNGDEDVLRFAVSDTGPGVAQHLQHRLFEDFSQADSSISRQFGGSGLGLAISKRLVELMGGTIGHINNADRGSTFWFTLPMSRAISARTAKEAPRKAPQCAGARILLVEDLQVNQELGHAILTKQGYHVDLADNGKQALAAVQANSYDLVLMDIQMPVMDGITATKAIRCLTGGASSVPIIALTANVLPDQIASFREAGMDGHVAKPIDRQELARVMGELLSRSRGRPGPHVSQEENGFDEATYQNARNLLPSIKLKVHVESLESHFQEILTAAANDAGLQELAHRLISHAGLLGFVEVSRRANDLQSAEYKSKRYEDAFSALQKAMQPASAKITELLRSL